MKQIADIEAKFKTGSEIRAHHADVKAMLLRRLEYQYRGDRSTEWQKFNAQLTANARDFDSKQS